MTTSICFNHQLPPFPSQEKTWRIISRSFFVGTWGPQQLSGSDRPTSETLSKMTWRETNDVKPTFQPSPSKWPNVLNPKMDYNLGRWNILWGRTKKMGQSSDGFLSPIETTCLEVTKLIILVHSFGEKNVERVGYSPTLPGIPGMFFQERVRRYISTPHFNRKNTWKQQTNKNTKKLTHTHTHCRTKTSSDESKRMIPWPVITNLRSVATWHRRLVEPEVIIYLVGVSPFEKYLSKWESPPIFGMKIKHIYIYIWNHHLVQHQA